MEPPGRTRAAVVAVTMALSLAACGIGSTPLGGTPEAGPTGESAPAAAGDSASPAPEEPLAATPSGEASAGPRQPDDRVTQPLAIAVHHTSPLQEVSPGRARRIVDGRTRLDLATGRPVRALRQVVLGRVDAAVVPASALGPQVRALTVAGVDPVRRPDRYPIRTAADEAPGPVVTVTVVGDIMLGRGVAAAAAGSGSAAPALRPMSRRLAAADVTVGNLESTLSRAGAPTQGGDSFAADSRVRRGLRRAGFDVIGLANNHLGDYGPRALVATVRRLRAGGLRTFGAGANPRQAWRPAVVDRHGVRVGFLGFNAIGETPEVAPGRPGAVSVSMPPRTGPLDRSELRRFERAVRRLDRRVDAVVAMPHWGTQYTNRPEPVQRRVARRLVRAGADVVVGGHPHWLQGAEMVGGSLVVHSLGNFVFDMDFMRETMRGAVLELVLWGGEVKAAELVPYVMDRRFAPRVVTGQRAEEVLTLLRETSGPAFRG